MQQRLADMKKTLQRELRVPTSSLDSDAEQYTTTINPNLSDTASAKVNTKDDDVNFKYLKHVLIKFLTSREYEVKHYHYINNLIKHIIGSKLLFEK